MEFIFLITGLILGAAGSWIFLKSKISSQPIGVSNELFQNTEKERAILSDRLNTFTTERENLIKELSSEREKTKVTEGRLEAAKEKFLNMQEKINTQKTEVEELQKKLTTEFENIANRILEDKSQKFTQQNRENLDIILNPLKEKIKDFEEKVDKTYKAESAERITLKAEIKNLVDLNKQISEEANNLARALKGDNKKQGNWGEVILEKILERSGLVKDQEYKTQVNASNDDGKRIQPDVVIFLPDNKHIIVDAKVSLVAYDAYANSEAEADKANFMREHLRSLRDHVKGLSEKSYQTSKDFHSPDFVMLFVPIESSFSVAVQADQELFNYAWDRKIVIVSPSTLLASLRTIASIWKQERQTRNALEIARQSGALYDKFVGFLEDMEKIGRGIRATQENYDSAVKKLSDGNGNLIRSAQKIQELGAKNQKQIPEKFIERIEEPIEKILD